MQADGNTNKEKSRIVDGKKVIVKVKPRKTKAMYPDRTEAIPRPK